MKRSVLSFCLLLSACLPALADMGTTVPEDFPDKKRQPLGAQIFDKIGADIPKDVRLTTHRGEQTTFGAYLGTEKPAIVVMGYYNCPMLCSLVLNGTIDGLKEVPFKAGEDYELVVVSIDAKETREVAAAKHKNYAASWGVAEATTGMTFHTATQPEITRLADSLGFGHVWDDDLGQFAHGAGIFIVDPDGKLTHTLYGVNFRPGDLKFALIDSASGKVGTVVDKIIMSCFQYYSDNHKYGFYIFGLVRLVGAVTLIFLGGLLIALWGRERARKKLAAI